MKNINNICFIIQARTQSTRVPNKMLRPFADSNLFEIAINKILQSSIIPKENFYGTKILELFLQDKTGDFIAEIKPENIASIKMVQKNGFNQLDEIKYIKQQ